MHILEVNKFFHGRRGAERHFLDLVELLRKRGNEVAIFSMEHPENIATPYEKYFVSQVGYNADDSTVWQKIVGIGRLFWSFQAKRNMARLLDDFQPDIVHIHNAYHQLSFSFLPVIRKRGTPIVMTVHDYHLISPDKDMFYPEVGQRYWKFLFVKKYGLGKRLLLVLKSYWERNFGFRDMIDGFIAPSAFVKELLVRGGIPESKILVIPHFLAERFWMNPSEEALSLPGDFPFSRNGYALYSGGVSEEKNISELVSIFERLRFPLVLAGPILGGFRAEDSEYARFVGSKETDELRALIANAKCVVSASRLPETFGLVVNEGYAFGKPFFGYQTGAFPELVSEGKTGCLAKTKEEFSESVGEFFSGGAHFFSSEEIKSFARSRWGEDAYYEVLSALLDAKSRGIDRDGVL